jgi:hypothetical protein
MRFRHLMTVAATAIGLAAASASGALATSNGQNAPTITLVAHGGGGAFFGFYPYFDDDYAYGGGGCYWNCRQFHGPAYCSRHSYNYCY